MHYYFHPTVLATAQYSKPEASNRVQELPRGHPHLVQLLCREIVNLKNEQPIHLRTRVTVEDVEAAVSVALTVGSEFFSNINLNQVDEDGREVLRWLATHEPANGIPMSVLRSHIANQTDIEPTLRQLLRRELIEEIGGCYRFQTPLIKHWFASQKV